MFLYLSSKKKKKEEEEEEKHRIGMAALVLPLPREATIEEKTNTCTDRRCPICTIEN